MFDFRWIDWNLNKIDSHNVAREQVEYTVNHPFPGYPRRAEADKYLVWGQSEEGLYLQVVYVIEPDERIFVIHARPLTSNEKHRLKRSRRSRR